MSKPIPKRHHYIPEMLQKRFVNETGGLWFYSKERPEKGVIATKPGNIFVEGHLYSTLEADGERDPAVELFYSRLESEAEHVVEKLVQAARSGGPLHLTPDELEIWHHFVFYQQKRVPDFFGRVSDSESFPSQLEEILTHIEARRGPIPAHLRQQVTEKDTMERLRKNALVGSLSVPSQMVQEALQSRGLAIAVPKQRNKAFVLGSNPMARLGVRNGSSFANPEVELWFPIAHDVAVAPYGKPGEVRFAYLGDPDVRKINRGIFAGSTVVASGSKDLIESLRIPR